MKKSTNFFKDKTPDLGVEMVCGITFCQQSMKGFTF